MLLPTDTPNGSSYWAAPSPFSTPSWRIWSGRRAAPEPAAFGVSFGGVLNILLDPLFVLPQFLGLGAVGAGIATALSNGAVACFAVYLVRRRGATYLNLLPANLRYAAQYLRPILAIGFPSALQYALTVVATAAQADFVSQYPTEAVAALGIVKKTGPAAPVFLHRCLQRTSAAAGL